MYTQKKGSVLYKHPDMECAQFWGSLFISESTEIENKFEIKKCNLETGQYEHTNELTEWQGHVVADGFYTFVPEVTPQIHEPTNAEIAQMLSDLQADLIIAGVI